MRKRLIALEAHVTTAPDDSAWLDLDGLAEVEISSEDAAHPIEHALQPGNASGWRAGGPGPQAIRLVFGQPQRLSRIRLHFEDRDSERTQEYVLRGSTDGGKTFREIVRQQWNFSPNGSTAQIEDYRTEMAALTVLELNIVPHIGGGPAVASLESMRLA